MVQGAIEDAVSTTIRNNAEVVERWLAEEPGSWGFLAGKAVTACREGLNRRLTDLERRQVWALLWHRLIEMKGA